MSTAPLRSMTCSAARTSREGIIVVFLSRRAGPRDGERDRRHEVIRHFCDALMDVFDLGWGRRGRSSTRPTSGRAGRSARWSACAAAPASPVTNTGPAVPARTAPPAASRGRMPDPTSATSTAIASARPASVATNAPTTSQLYGAVGSPDGRAASRGAGTGIPARIASSRFRQAR